MNHTDEMGMELPQWVTLPLCDRTVTIEASGEFTLPDYQPEIRRLLSVTPVVLPAAKYVGASQLEWNGTVDYQVLYVSADGGLCSLSLSSEYASSLPLEADGDVDLGMGVSSFVTSVAESVSSRVSAPRRLSIRCRIRSHACAYGRMSLEEQCRGSSAVGRVLRRYAKARTMRVSGGSSEPISLHEELGELGADASVVSAYAVPFVQETRQTGDGVCVSGEVGLRLIVSYGDGRLETVSRRLPFTGEIELEEEADADVAVASGTVGQTSVVCSEDGRISCDVELLLEARVRQNLPVRYTVDLYSTERKSQCHRRDYRLPVVCRAENANLSQSERLKASEYRLSEDMQIVDAWGSVLWENAESVGDRFVLNGQSRYSLLCNREGELSVCEISLPLRYETDGSEGMLCGFDARADVIRCRARLEGDVLSLDSEIAVIAELFGEEAILPVREVELGEPVEARGSGLTICYPAEDEDAWAVAKRYAVEPERLVERQGKVPYYIF